MRSTGFVILSICVHALAVAAIALNPQRISEGPHGAEVEVITGSESETPGVENAPADKVTEAPPAPAPALTPVAPQPQVEKTVEKPVSKPVEKVVEKPVVKKAAPKKVAAAPVVKKAAPTEEPEKLDPETDSNIPTAPVEQAQQEEPVKQEEPKQEEPAAPTPAPVPVAAKEEKPQPVQPQQTADEKHDDMAAAAAAAAVAAKNDKAQGTSTAAAAGTSAAAEADLGQGGATKAGAVAYTELKQMTGNRAPVYPLAARRDKRQGNVELLYRVTKEGTVTEVQIAQSSGSDDLDNAALKAVSKFRFVPGQEGWARHPVHFNLKGDTAEAPGRLRTKVGAQDQE